MIVEATGDKRYVTYLKQDREKFDKNKIEINLYTKHKILSKPYKAWWGSPIDAYYGWKEYVNSEESSFNYDFNKPIYWKLKPGSKVYEIDWTDVEENSSLMKYTDKYDIAILYDSYINFEKMIKDNIVAVELMNANIGHMFDNNLEIMFNSWDCESIVVLDKDALLFENE